MAERDYSGTPLVRKLGIREGSRVVVLGAPDGFELGALPIGATMLPRVRAPLDVALLFVTRRVELDRRFPRLAHALDPAGRLWVAWPKKASTVATDLSFGSVQAAGLGAGLVDNKSASIDQVFQGLQFVVRLRDRPKP
ncbi:MAG TPA: DUF3052 domain-containing protein [Actinomycetota bacterium]|jgi:hypothetical protein|nr:DUF3052 domain-containing protein [Actinomycetota bacterium]